MPEIKLQHIVSVSSEDKNYPAENLLKNDGFKKWKCVAGEKQAVVVFQFEKASEITQIDIGNEGSAFIEVLVGKSSSSENDYQVIIVASSFMNPTEARALQNPNRVRIFGSDQLSKAVNGQKWDRAKVVCTQQFNKSAQYGLSFIKFHSGTDGTEKNSAKAEPDSKPASLGAFKLKSDTDSSPSLIRSGSLFERAKTRMDAIPSTTGAAAIRAASKVSEHSAAETSKQASTTKVAAPAANKDRKSTVSPPPAKKPKPDEDSDKTTAANKEKKPSKPLGQIMKKVVFALSGFQNPERADLRDAAVDMGAIYKPDWEKGCTHLVCAFENTPKYTQVSGHGRIVKKTWITDCYAKKQLLPWRQYRLGRAPSPKGSKSGSDTEDEEPASKIASKTKKTSSENPESHAAAAASTDKTDSSSKTDGKPAASGSKAGDSASGESGDAASKAARDKQSDDEWDPFGDDLGIASEVDTEEEIRRFEELQAKKTTPTTTPQKVTPAASAPSTPSTPTAALTTAAGTKPTPVADTKHSATTTAPKRKSGNKYDVSTDEEDNAANNGHKSDDGLPVLPDFFNGKTFLLCGKHDDRRTLVRYIVAYNGRVADYMDDSVKYVVTSDEWDDTFDKALSDNSKLIFVRPAWLHTCHSSQKSVPYQKYSVTSPK